MNVIVYVALKDEIQKKLDKMQEPPPVKQVKPLPKPDDAPRKKRGGRRYVRRLCNAVPCCTIIALFSFKKLLQNLFTKFTAPLECLDFAEFSCKNFCTFIVCKIITTPIMIYFPLVYSGTSLSKPSKLRTQ